MASELKPCICGKTPRLDIKKGLAGITKVPFYREQIMCRCGVSSKIFKAPRKAVEAWNTRHGTLTNEGTTIPTPVAPVSPDATGKCEELVTVGYAPSEYDMGLDYQQLGISRLYPKSCASGAVAVVTRSQAVELLAAKDARIKAETELREDHQQRNKELDAKLAAAENALEPFADHANDQAVDDTGWRDKETVKIVVSIGDLRKARAVLGGKPL